MTSDSANTARNRRLFLFLTGGGVATLTHWLVMLLMIQAGSDARLATAIGATAGLVINYHAQYRFTFQSRLRHRVAFLRYLAGASLGWGLNLAGFSLMHSLTGMALTSQAFATGAATAANYLLANRFVFQEESCNDRQ